MSYKAIIFDLDGTAIPNGPHSHPSARLVAAVKAAQPQLVLTTATGRPISNAGYVITELGLTHPCVISGGSQIVDPMSQKILWEALIPAEAVQAVLEICRPYPHELVVRNELFGTGSPAAERVIEGDVNVMYVGRVPHKDAEIMAAQLEKVPGIITSLVTSWQSGGLDIHISPADGTKEHGIAELLKRLGLQKSEVIGVGDGGNDVHLFNAVGHKVAMGNATDRLKSLADEVIDSVSEDGLAKLVENT